jgi:hypothetical protein
MKKILLFVGGLLVTAFIGSTIYLNFIKDKEIIEVKTLYGLWSPKKHQFVGTMDTLAPWYDQFAIEVEGKCEDIQITHIKFGETLADRVQTKVANAKCFGNRDELSFDDTELFEYPVTVKLKMDASKDTLIGTLTPIGSGDDLPIWKTANVVFVRK